MSKLAFICSPYAGDVNKNVHVAKAMCRWAIKKGYTPIAPHLHYPQFMDDTDPIEHSKAGKFCLDILDVCSTIIVLDVPPTKGMQAEIDTAGDTWMPMVMVHMNDLELY